MLLWRTGSGPRRAGWRSWASTTSQVGGLLEGLKIIAYAILGDPTKGSEKGL